MYCYIFIIGASLSEPFSDEEKLQVDATSDISTGINGHMIFAFPSSFSNRLAKVFRGSKRNRRPVSSVFICSSVLLCIGLHFQGSQYKG